METPYEGNKCFSKAKDAKVRAFLHMWRKLTTLCNSICSLSENKSTVSLGFTRNISIGLLGESPVTSLCRRSCSLYFCQLTIFSSTTFVPKITHESPPKIHHNNTQKDSRQWRVTLVPFGETRLKGHVAPDVSWQAWSSHEDWTASHGFALH